MARTTSTTILTASSWSKDLDLGIRGRLHSDVAANLILGWSYMNHFWEGFEKRSFGLMDVATGLGHMGLTHAVPNALMLKLLKSKRVAENIGDHFSSGLFNAPISRMSAVKSGLSAGVAPEIPIMHQEAQHMGSKLREWLGGSLVGHLGTENGVNALKEVMKGNAAGAAKLDPELVDSVLEFAKQHKTNPFTLAANMKNLAKGGDHPLISNIAPNLIRLPRRVKAKAGAPVTPGAESFMGDKGPKFTGDPAKDDAILEHLSNTLLHPKTTKLKEMAGAGYNKIKGGVKALTGKQETESYLPPINQLLGPAVSPRKWERGAGAMLGSAAVGASGLGALTGLTNAGKYLYFSTPARRVGRKLLNFNVGGKEYGLRKGEDLITSKRLSGAFERGLVHDKPLNPVTNAFHRYMFSGLQGEAARTTNAVGRGIADAVHPEHRKAVYENIMGAIHGVPGSMQAKAPPPPLKKQLKPFALPAAAAGTAGAIAYGAGKYQNSKEEGRPVVGRSGNVVPFVRPPQMEAAG